MKGRKMCGDKYDHLLEYKLKCTKNMFVCLSSFRPPKPQRSLSDSFCILSGCKLQHLQTSCANFEACDTTSFFGATYNDWIKGFTTSSH